MLYNFPIFNNQNVQTVDKNILKPKIRTAKKSLKTCQKKKVDRASRASAVILRHTTKVNK